MNTPHSTSRLTFDVSRLTFDVSRLTFHALILTCFILLALAYGLIVPPFENLDETEHFEVVRYIAETGRLPVHGTSEAASYHYRQEASQPPLYHLLSAGLVRLLRLPTDNAAATWRTNPWVACGPGAASLYDNRAVLYHDPNREALPWHGTLLTLHLLRIWSTLLQTITVAATYSLARLAFPKRRGVGLVAMSVVAFNPQFLLVASGVNNDNLLTPLVTIGLYLLLRTWRDGLSSPRTIALSIIIGLAGLTKLSGWLLLPLALVILLIRAYRPPSPIPHSPLFIPHWSLFIGHCSLFIVHWSLVIVHWSLLVAHCSLISGWWFWRNWQLYGDPTALRPMLELVGVRGASVLQSFRELGTMFRSFWGQIPCSFYPPGFYAFYAVLTALALGGLVWGWRRLARAERATATILGTWFLLILASWARWNALTPAPGGRLLFPALPAAALLMSLGLGRCSSLIRRLPLFIGLLLMALLTVARILPGFFAPPPRYADAAAVQPAHPLNATLGDGVRLLGYDLDLDECDSTLDATLYWQSLAPMDADYTLVLQLVSPVPGDTTLRFNYNSWPGHGNYPTSTWQPGQVIADRYRFRLPEAEFSTQAWDVRLALYQTETRDRLPVYVDGNAAGDALTLARLRVPGNPPACPEEGKLTSAVSFGDEVALTHAWVTPAREGYQVSLCWESLQPLPADYTVFVHLQDSSGELVATADGPPMQGAFPSSMWRPGDVILDIHHLGTMAEKKDGYITVGLYEPEDGSRLPVYIGGTSVPDAAVPVWPARP